MAPGSRANEIIFSTDAGPTGFNAWAAQSRNFSFSCSVDNGLSGDPDGGCNSTVARSPPAQVTSISARPLAAPFRLSALTEDAAANTVGGSNAVI